MTKDVSLLKPEFGTVFAPHMQTIAIQVTAIGRSDRLGMGARVEQGNIGHILLFACDTGAVCACVTSGF